MSKIYSYAGPGEFNLPYLIVHEIEGAVFVTVRGPQVRGPEDYAKLRDTETVQVPEEDLIELFVELGTHLYGEDIMELTGAFVQAALTGEIARAIQVARKAVA